MVINRITDSDKHADMKQPEPNDLTNYFITLLTANQRRIFSFILSRVPSVAEAQDLMQETTTLMWLKFEQFTPGTDFVAWGIKIAQHKIMDYRKNRHNQVVHLSDDAIQALEQEPLKRPIHEDDRIQILKDCLRKLTDTQQQLILLRYYQDNSIGIIAQRIGKSIPHLYKIMSRIHDSLLRCVRQTLARGDDGVS